MRLEPGRAFGHTWHEFRLRAGSPGSSLPDQSLGTAGFWGREPAESNTGVFMRPANIKAVSSAQTHGWRSRGRAARAGLPPARRSSRWARRSTGSSRRAVDTIWRSRAASSSAASARAGHDRPQDRRDAGVHRHAGLFRPSRRSQPRRSRRRDPPGRAADAVLARRDRRAFRPHHLCQALPHSADRHGQQSGVHAAEGGRRGAGAAARCARPARWGWRRPPPRP